MILPIEKGIDIVMEDEVNRKRNAKPSHLASGLAILMSLHISCAPAEFFCCFPLCRRALKFT
jgi:hypothetical protein